MLNMTQDEIIKWYQAGGYVHQDPFGVWRRVMPTRPFNERRQTINPDTPISMRKSGMIHKTYYNGYPTAGWYAIRAAGGERGERMSKLAEINQILNQAADLIKQLEPGHQVLMIASLIESLDMPADTMDGLVTAVRDTLNERLEAGGW